MSFDIPGTSSDIADSAIIAKYGFGGSEVPLVPVIKLPAGMTASQPAIRADLLSGFSAVSRIGAGKYVFTAGGGGSGAARDGGGGTARRPGRLPAAAAAC